MSKRADADDMTLAREFSNGREFAANPQLNVNKLVGAGVPTVRRARRAFARARAAGLVRRSGSIFNRRWVPTRKGRERFTKAGERWEDS